MATVTYQNQQGVPAQAVYPPAYTQPGQPQYAQVQQIPAPAHNVVVLTQPAPLRGGGTCPHCGIGFARSDYSMIGILIAILFFPLGIICCLMMTERRCTHCRASM